MSAPIRVLLVDDHAMLRTGFRTILDLQPDIAVIGEAATGSEAVTLAGSLLPDVITMDVQMPDMDGIEATRRIRADDRIRASIAIVTTFDRDDYLFDALDAGASGFLLKNAGPEELVAAVRALAAGDGMLAPEVTRRVLQRFAAASVPEPVEGTRTPGPVPQPAAGTRPSGPVPEPVEGTPSASGASTSSASGSALPALPSAALPSAALPEPLTDRESEVLRLVAEAWSNAEIAAELFIGEATVKTHVSRILQKLGARDRVQAVVLAHRLGLA
ncbi:response regulator [Microbacterium xylanilyticum]